MSGDGRPEFDAILPARDDLRPLHICWFLHNHCNHRCTYCHESNWSGSFKWLSLDHVRSFIDQVQTHYGDRRIHVSLTGGEPTLWPDFEKCVEFLAERGLEIGMTSNGAKPREFFERIAPHFSWINLSFHPEFTRTDKFLDLVDGLSGLVAMSVRIMLPADSKLWLRSMEFRKLLESSVAEGRVRGRIQVEMVKTVSGFGTVHTAPMSFSADQEIELSKWPSVELANADSIRVPYESVLGEYVTHQVGDSSSTSLRANELVETGKLNFKNWICNIGIEQLFVGADGFVFRAGCGVGPRLGRLGGRISFPDKPVRCWKNYCHCVTDIAISKVSPKWVETPSQKSNSANQILLSGADFHRRPDVRLMDLVQEGAFALEASKRDRSLRGRILELYLLMKKFWLTARWSRRWQN